MDLDNSLYGKVELAAKEAIKNGLGESADPLLRWSARPEHGDLQINAPMSLAKKHDGNPRELAKKIVEALDLKELSTTIPQIAGPGFINITLSDEVLTSYARNLFDDPRGGVPRYQNGKNVVVDYGGANIAKEMHVGHLRSTIIGDSIVRVLDFLGHNITRQDHLGDWGTQFGMLVEHLTVQGELPDKFPELTDLNEFYRQAKIRFDSDKEFATRARKRVTFLQQGDTESLRAWRHIYDETIQHVSEMYNRLGVLMTPQDARGESFYNEMLGDICQELLDKGIAIESDGALVIYSEGELNPDGSPFGLMIRKSDGGYGYATTDLAALKYAVEFDQAQRIVYVVDDRQSQHFHMVFDAAQRAGWLTNTKPEHAKFGTILGENGKPFKTREGTTVKLGSLLDEAIEKASSLLSSRELKIDEQQKQALINALGIGAVKYGDLSSKRQNNYVFSWDRMLAMQGNTSPYMQYAVARVNSILARAEKNDLEIQPHDTFKISTRQEAVLIRELSKFGETLSKVEQTLEPHHLANYLFNLSQTFTAFYENCPILRVEDQQIRKTRLALSSMTARTIKSGLNLLGIESPEKL